MKKLIGTAALAALLAASAFAEITFGSWLRILGVPAAYDGNDVVSGIANSWGWGARVARFNISGVTEDERLGFALGVYTDAWDGIQPNGDDYAIWAKPWDWLKVSFGRWDYTAFRGDLCFGSWAWLRPYRAWLWDDEGFSFDALGNKVGMQFELTPIEGLLIMWNLPVVKGFNDAYKMFEQQDIAAKYTIADVGTIKVGWGGKGQRATNGTPWKAGDNDVDLGNGYYWDGSTITKIPNNVTTTDDKYWGDINVGFDLTAVENLYLTVGAKISIADSDYKADDFGFLKVAVGASYQILDNFKISANVGLQTYEVNDPAMQCGLGVDVGLTDALVLTADVRALFDNIVDVDPTIAFLVGLQYNMSSNGYVGIGFQGSTNSCGFLNDDTGINADKSDSFCWAVPIAVSVWF